ncbi:hypothetical protein DFS33DRAFT_794792 [Desarmillaria ectypa]|nr:hypothetical protein DFS33DRAFT_794792 [Desarmillaria ectypa]
MIMEYVDGENLSTIWRSLDAKQREQVCLAMADVWVQIISITFNSIGSIYERNGGEFMIGPMTRLASNRSTSIAPPQLEKCGPFSSVRGWLLATARRDLDYVEAPEDADTSTRYLPLVLEHIDFAPRNILVSRSDPTKIVAVIDWEGSRSVPMKRLLTLLTNRIISQVPEWERAIGQELQPLRVLYDRATYSKVDPSLLPPAPYLAMSASY